MRGAGHICFVGDFHFSFTLGCGSGHFPFSLLWEVGGVYECLRGVGWEWFLWCVGGCRYLGRLFVLGVGLHRGGGSWWGVDSSKGACTRAAPVAFVFGVHAGALCKGSLGLATAPSQPLGSLCRCSWQSGEEPGRGGEPKCFSGCGGCFTGGGGGGLLVGAWGWGLAIQFYRCRKGRFFGGLGCGGVERWSADSGWGWGVVLG